MKKPNSSAAVIACFVFLLFFFVLESNLSILSKVNVSQHYATSTHCQDPGIERTGIYDAYPCTGHKILPRRSPVADKKCLELRSISEREPLPPPPLPSSRWRKILCDRSHEKYDICSINAPTVLDPSASAFYVVDPNTSTSFVENIRPHPRKWETSVMNRIKELTITSGPVGQKCIVQHNVPALVLSLDGYTGNFWHEFNDGFIPLFITVHTFFRDQDFVLVISRAHDWWVSKYRELLQVFSTHRIINLENATATHCFTSATLGLVSHGFMTIDPTLIPNSKNFIHFRALIDKAYSHGWNHPSKATRPRLVLTCRKGNVGRVILNQAKVKRLAQEIGFDVIIFVPTPYTPLQQSYELINSSHAMIGVHGAALTHSLFLRPGSVFVQVVPIGLEWVSEVCFGTSARSMGLEYMEYNISVEESSLLEKYDKNDLVIKDPVAFRGKDWSEVTMNVYLKEQNVRLDLFRFREYLKGVYKKAKQFMDREG